MVEVARQDDVVCFHGLPFVEGNGDGFVVNDVHALGFPSRLQHAAQGLVSADHALHHASAFARSMATRGARCMSGSRGFAPPADGTSR